MDPSAAASSRKAAFEKVVTQRLQAFMTVEDEHKAIFRELGHRWAACPRGTELISMGEPLTHVYVLLSGWAMRFKLLPDGRRQIVGFALPGDFVCLDACVLRRAEYTVALVTEANVATVDVSEMFEMGRHHPELHAAVLWCSLREESLLMERLVSLGRRSAYERVAHVLLELYRRLQVVGHTRGTTFPFPVSQALLADVLGLSNVHVNRTFRRLADNGLIRVRYGTDGQAEILDFDGLCEAASFDERYLHLDRS